MSAARAATAAVEGAPRAPWIQRAGLIALVLVLGSVAWYFGRDLRSAAPALKEWIDSLGFWGPAAYALLYAAGAVLALPGSVLTLLGGVLFGLVKGTLTVFVGATLGSSLAFLISRYLAREWIAARAARYPALAKIDRAVGEQGLKIVFLLRLSPVFPFTALNFMLGLTRVRFPDYVLASFGMIPGTLLYVYYGKLIGDVAQIAAGTAPSAARGAGYWAVLGLGLAATLIVSVFVARLARRALDQELPQEEGA